MRLCIDCNGEPIAVVDKKFGVVEKLIRQDNERIGDYAADRILYNAKRQKLFTRLCMFLYAMYIRNVPTIESCNIGDKNYSPLLNSLAKRSNNYLYHDILLDVIVYIYRVGYNRIDYYEINKKSICRNRKFFFTASR